MSVYEANIWQLLRKESGAKGKQQGGLAFLAAASSTENQSYFMLCSMRSTSWKVYSAQCSPGGMLAILAIVPLVPSKEKKSCQPPSLEHLYSKAVLLTYIVPLFCENTVYACSIWTAFAAKPAPVSSRTVQHVAALINSTKASTGRHHISELAYESFAEYFVGIS